MIEKMINSTTRIFLIHIHIQRNILTRVSRRSDLYYIVNTVQCAVYSVQ